MSLNTKPQLIKFDQTAPIYFLEEKKKVFLQFQQITVLNNHSRWMLFDTQKHIWCLIHSTEKFPASHVEKKIQQNNILLFLYISYSFWIILITHILSVKFFKWMSKPLPARQVVRESRLLSGEIYLSRMTFQVLSMQQWSFPILAIIMPVQPCFKSKMGDAWGST